MIGNLIYSANGSEVRDVVVDGRILMQDGPHHLVRRGGDVAAGGGHRPAAAGRGGAAHTFRTSLRRREHGAPGVHRIAGLAGRHLFYPGGRDATNFLLDELQKGHPRRALNGAGSGATTARMLERGWQVTPIEPSTVLRNVLEKRLRVPAYKYAARSSASRRPTAASTPPSARASSTAWTTLPRSPSCASCCARAPCWPSWTWSGPTPGTPSRPRRSTTAPRAPSASPRPRGSG